MKTPGQRAVLLAISLLGAPILLEPSVGQPPVPPRGTLEQEPPVPSWVQVHPPCQDGLPARTAEPANGEPASPASSPPPAGNPAVLEGPEPQAAAPQILVRPQGEGREDELAFTYDSTQATIRFRYREEDRTPRDLELRFGDLHEYVDRDRDGRLGPGDEVVSSFEIGGRTLHFARTWEGDCGIRLQWVYLLTVDWEALQSVPEAEQAAFLEDKPRLVLRFTHLAEGQHSDGAYVVPERVKIDIGVEDYSSVRNGTRLAFASTLRATGPTETRGNEVAASGDGPTLGYSWAATAVADGDEVAVPVDVQRSPEDWGEEVRVTFSYPMAASILHDPELGLLDLPALASRLVGLAEGHPGALAAGAAGAAVLLLGAGALRRRRP